MSLRYQQGSLFRIKQLTKDDVWVFRYYDHSPETAAYRKVRIGSVREYPLRRDAEKAVFALRARINAGVADPRRVADLIAHFRDHELMNERRAYATNETYRTLLARYIEPRWGGFSLHSVRTVDVEKWLDHLALAPGSKAKIRSTFSVLCNHAIRYQWLTENPIRMVRSSSKRVHEKSILSPDEFRALVAELPVRERAMVLLAGSTGLRRSELIALTWADIHSDTLEVDVLRSCVRNRFRATKTECSRRPVPLHPSIVHALRLWRRHSPFPSESDFLFPSLLHQGRLPADPDNIMQRKIRPALERIGVVGKEIGWHSFRHGFATNLRALGVDIKVAQELLRHANSRTTLDLYTRAVSAQKRDANARIVNLLVPQGSRPEPHPRAGAF